MLGGGRKRVFPCVDVEGRKSRLTSRSVSGKCLRLSRPSRSVRWTLEKSERLSSLSLIRSLTNLLLTFGGIDYSQLLWTYDLWGHEGTGLARRRSWSPLCSSWTVFGSRVPHPVCPSVSSSTDMTTSTVRIQLKGSVLSLLLYGRNIHPS